MHFSHFIDIVQHIIEDGKGFEMFTTYKLPHQPSIFFFEFQATHELFHSSTIGPLFTCPY